MANVTKATTGPASTPWFDNLLTGEHAGAACYVSESPSVSPPSVVEHNITVRDSCDTFCKPITLMNNQPPTTTSPCSDAGNTAEEAPARRPTGRKYKPTAHPAGQVAQVSQVHVYRVANNKGAAGSAILRKARDSIAFDT